MRYIKSLKTIFTLLLIGSSCSLYAQNDTIKTVEIKNKKAWEFGIGGSVAQLNRMYINDLYITESDGYRFNLDMKHALWGGDIYVARELNKHFYFYIVMGMGGAKVHKIDDKSKTKFYYTGGFGLQWRLSPLLKSRYVEPYFRLGLQYTHRDFLVDYEGLNKIKDDEIRWTMRNNYNKDGYDARNLYSIVGGFGVNIWFNDRIDMGAIANYMHRPSFVSKQKNVADAVQGSIRLMFRFGGKSKKESPSVIQVPTYIDRVVEVPIEKVITVEKEITTFAMLQNVYFKFDTDEFTEESFDALDKAAELLKTLEGRHFLVVGYTDSRGSNTYNIKLSKRRAAAVVKTLESRGVPASMLKSRGIGKRVAIVAPSKSHQLREGDRRVVIEEIFIEDYWNYIPKNN